MEDYEAATHDVREEWGPLPSFSLSMPCIASSSSVKEALSLSTSVSFDCRPIGAMGFMNTAMSFMEQGGSDIAEGVEGAESQALEAQAAAASSSKSTLTPTASPFVPRAHLGSTPRGSENKPPAYWEPARTTAVTIEPPRPQRRRTTQSTGRRARHLAHMGQSGKAKPRILGDRNINA